MVFRWLYIVSCFARLLIRSCQNLDYQVYLGFTLATACYFSPSSYLIMNPPPSDQVFLVRVLLPVQVLPPIHLRHRLIM